MSWMALSSANPVGFVKPHPLAAGEAGATPARRVLAARLASATKVTIPTQATMMP
jgi:hypothetical protein